MSNYIVRDEGGSETTIEAWTIGQARALAEKWVREGEWDASAGPVYLDVSLIPVGPDGAEDRDEAERITVVIDQVAPPCPGYPGGHDWHSPIELVGGIESNPGVWGHGGGVYINEACLRCGCRRRTDTWAQNPRTGEQGFTEVTYAPGHYDVAGGGR